MERKRDYKKLRTEGSRTINKSNKSTIKRRRNFFLKIPFFVNSIIPLSLKTVKLTMLNG